MNTTQRLEAVVLHSRISVSEFERRAGLSRGSIHNYKRRGSVPIAAAEAIHAAFPYFEVPWLMTGLGDAPAFVSSSVSKELAWQDKEERYRAIIRQQQEEIIDLKLKLSKYEGKQSV